MPYFRKYWWLLLLAGLALGGSLYRQATRRQIDFRAFPLRAEVRYVELSRLGDTLRLRKTPEGWIVGERRRADTLRVRSLMELLASLHLDMPLDIEGGEEKLGQPLDSAIGVEIGEGSSSTIRYRLLYMNADYLCLMASGGRVFRVSAPGFSPRAVRHLSLSPGAWSDAFLGLECPSELDTVEVVWTCDSSQSFRFALISGFDGTLYRCCRGDGDSLWIWRKVPYDTIRIASFLQSLTTLSYDGKLDTVGAERLGQLRREQPFARVKLGRRGGMLVGIVFTE